MSREISDRLGRRVVDARAEAFLPRLDFCLPLTCALRAIDFHSVRGWSESSGASPARRLKAPDYRDYIEFRPREPREPRLLLLLREPRERLPRLEDLPPALRPRDLDERLFRAMISSGLRLDYLHAGAASSSYELPDKGNEGDHEEQMNQPARHVEDDKTKQPSNQQNHRKSG